MKSDEVRPHLVRARSARLPAALPVLLPALLFILTACSNPLMPTIAEFSASPETLTAGESNEVTFNWSVANADSVHLTSAAGLELEVTGQVSHVVTVESPTTFTLVARNFFGGVSRELDLGSGNGDDPGDQPPGDEPPGDEPPGDEPPGDEPPGDEPGDEAPAKILILIAGQSNAGGRGQPFPEGKAVADDGVYMLSEGATPDDWQWVKAAEPSETYPEAKAHGFLVTLGNELKRATGADVYLVQSAVGGTGMRFWLPGGESGYFDTALARAKFAADDLGLPVDAVAWFQGESDTQYAAERELYSSRTEKVFEAFHDGLPGSPPILFVQLAKRLADGIEPQRNLAYQTIRELQRALDPGAVKASLVAPGAAPGAAGDAPSYYRLVVSHDLGMSDQLHVSRDGQKLLGRRLAHAFLSEYWDGPGSRTADRRGPRLLRIERTTLRTARVVLSRAVNASSNYGGYFAILVDGVPQSLASIQRDPDDSRAILLTTAADLPASNGRVAVRYMPPDDVGLYAPSDQAVFALDAATGLKLPLPAFGSPAEAVPTSFIQSE